MTVKKKTHKDTKTQKRITEEWEKRKINKKNSWCCCSWNTSENYHGRKDRLAQIPLTRQVTRGQEIRMEFS